MAGEQAGMKGIVNRRQPDIGLPVCLPANPRQSHSPAGRRQANSGFNIPS